MQVQKAANSLDIYVLSFPLYETESQSSNIFPLLKQEESNEDAN